MKPEDRFWAKVMPEPNTGCWLWTGGLNQKGYSQFWDGNRMTKGHRFAFKYFRGIIPNDLILDHLCRVRSCVNPDHLEPVTHAENLRRGINPRRTRTHCPKGHPYSGSNLYLSPDGRRDCRTCRAARDRASWQRKKTRRVRDG